MGRVGGICGARRRSAVGFFKDDAELADNAEKAGTGAAGATLFESCGNGAVTGGFWLENENEAVGRCAEFKVEGEGWSTRGAIELPNAVGCCVWEAFGNGSGAEADGNADGLGVETDGTNGLAAAFKFGRLGGTFAAGASTGRAAKVDVGAAIGAVVNPECTRPLGSTLDRECVVGLTGFRSLPSMTS